MLAAARYLTELIQDMFGAELAEPMFPADEPGALRVLCEASGFSSIEVRPATAEGSVNLDFWGGRGFVGILGSRTKMS